MAWTRSAISRLGKHLMSSAPPRPEHVRELHDLLLVYDDALDAAIVRIRDGLGVEMTSRLKNTGTILEKLRRSGGGSLPNIQDIAGIRIVKEMSLDEQTHLAEGVTNLFTGERREPKTVDRREEPSHGYRAVHVIVYAQDLPVEVQIRTRLQHQWANTFEKLADVVGRGIRYGETPDEWVADVDAQLKELISSDPTWPEVEKEALQRRGMTGFLIDLMLRLARTISGFETAFPDRRQITSPEVDENIRWLHQSVETVAQELQARRDSQVVNDGRPDDHAGTVER